MWEKSHTAYQNNIEIARENEKDEPAQPVQTNIYVNDAPCI